MPDDNKKNIEEAEKIPEEPIEAENPHTD